MNENPPEDKMKRYDDIKHQAQIDTIAQEIINRLKEIQNKRDIFEKRWIWELLQNALDAATQARKTEVEIIKSDNQITFRHNGRPFKIEEVAHLIYHGSTKNEKDIGKFGTGFLTTHLLSKKVIIKGIMEDSERFEFILDRNGSSSEEIKERMEENWEQYKRSLCGTINTTDQMTEYQYPLNNVASKTVDIGIEDLIKLAPYALAFNDKLGAIKITEPSRKIKFELAEERNEKTSELKIVKKEEEGKPAITHELWIVKDDDVEIAVKGKEYSEGVCQIESLQDIPKFFLSFPLFGTRDLPFPVVVNSRKFKPTEIRDGIFLGKENTDDIRQNKRLLEKASELFINWISDSDTDRREDIHNLLKLGHPSAKDLPDEDWYKGLLKKIMGKMIKSRVFKTESGNFITPDKGLIPVSDGLDEKKTKKLWDLCYRYLDYKNKIVAKELALEWAQIINDWIFIGLDLENTKITIEKMAERTENCRNLQDFKSKLSQDEDAFETLNDFYKLLLESDKSGLLHSKSILLDQNGNFKKKPTLFRDEGIDESLKDISSKLGSNVRNELLHPRISDDIQRLVNAKSEKDVLNQVIQEIKNPNNITQKEPYRPANIDLFHWLLEHDKFEYLDGYPVLSANNTHFISLIKSNKEKPLAPKEIWDESARNYAEIFPQDSIISSIYFEKIRQEDKWDKLKDMNIILINPIYKEAEEISRKDLEYFLVSELAEDNKEHEITTKVELSKIAFLETKDKGILDMVRKSKDRARKFLGFLFDYVIENDDGWNNPKEAGCICGDGSTHEIYPASWLGTLKDRLKVPVGKNKEEKPNAQILASIIKTDEKLIEKCKQDKPSALLRRLNISFSELMMHVAAKNDKIRTELDKAMGSLLSSFLEDPKQLGKIANLAETEKELFIKEIEDRIQTRDQIRRNQSIGSLVETILKSVLEKEGFKVERTGIGSDFVAEHDFIKDGVEAIIEVKKKKTTCWYIEVKATNQDFIRMTLTQAKEARDKSSKYALCVIGLNGLEPNEENIKHGAKFVTDIGEKIKDKVGEAENLEEEQDKIAGSGEIEIEINEGPIRLKINKRIWQDSKTLQEFSALFRGLQYG